MKVLNIVIPFMLLLSCNKFFKSDTEKYFEETFQLIKAKSVKKNEIDWDGLKKAVRDSLKNLNSNHEVHLAIAYTINLINDGHSIFGALQKSDDRKAINAKRTNNNTLSIPPIRTKILDEDIGYMRLTGLSIVNDSLSKRYTLEIRKALLELDKTTELSGWVLDLRSHGGGRLSCESLGLAPLFENPLIGFYWNNQNPYNEIICTHEYFKFGNNIQDSLFFDTTLANKNKKIAVLVDEKTVSSGEFLALAFKFQDNSKTFGIKTKGKTSHCGFYRLKDGAFLFLAEAYYCDIQKNIIREGIIPDVECDLENSMTEAVAWIKNSV